MQGYGTILFGAALAGLSMFLGFKMR